MLRSLRSSPQIDVGRAGPGATFRDPAPSRHSSPRSRDEFTLWPKVFGRSSLCLCPERGRQTGLGQSMSLAAVVRCFLAPLGHPVVADDPGHPQPIVLEYAAAASLLRNAMANMIAPPRDGVCVAPERQRQHLAGVGQALETLDRNETLDLFQFRAQPSRVVEIGFALAIGRPYLEDHRDHRFLQSVFGSSLRQLRNYLAAGRTGVQVPCQPNRD